MFTLYHGCIKSAVNLITHVNMALSMKTIRFLEPWFVQMEIQFPFTIYSYKDPNVYMMIMDGHSVFVLNL